MRPKRRKAHTQKREKRFKLKHLRGLSSCRFCHSSDQWKDRRGTRPRRVAALKRGDFDGALECHFEGENAMHIKEPKSTLHHSGTRRREMYRQAARQKARYQGS